MGTLKQQSSEDINYTDRILWTTIFYDKIETMAFISVETKAEVTMVKILSSINQILLCHCFVMVLFGLLFMADTEAADYDLEDTDYEESFLMERADAVSSLLPCLAALTIGAVVASGGKRVLLGIQQ